MYYIYNKYIYIYIYILYIYMHVCICIYYYLHEDRGLELVKTKIFPSSFGRGHFQGNLIKFLNHYMASNRFYIWNVIPSS